MLDWVWSKLSQVTVSIGSLKIQDMIKILKQSGHYFSVNVYVVDTVLRYYVIFMYGGRSIFIIGLYGFVEKLL